MSTSLVSTTKQGVKGRLRKSKEGMWGVTASEGADVKKFNSLQKIPGSSCYWMRAFCKLCSVEMHHKLLHPVILHPWAAPPLQEEPVATAWLGTFQRSSQNSVSCTDYFSLGYIDLDGEPLDTKEASNPFLTWLFICSIKTRNSGRGFGWEQKAVWTWLRNRQKATKKFHWRVI